ncbi:MAG: diguanylate cyclase [Burkholderiales bacterium]|nr:MAG: diguanylate cyclase [Burkholderiales bacterium]
MPRFHKSQIFNFLHSISIILWMMLICFFCSTSAYAQTAASDGFQLPSLFEGNQQLKLDVPMGVLVLPKTQTVDPNQLLQSPHAEKFRAWNPDLLLPTSAEQDVWLRLQLPIQNRPQSWLLRIPRLTLHKATLFQSTPAAPSVWQQQSAGIGVPSSSWPMRSRDPIFEISTRSDLTQVFFIQLQNGNPITENIQLIHSADFGNGANYAGTLNGLTIGVFMMLTLISLISWRINRNSHFAWLALLSFAVLLAQLTVSGYMTMRIWTNSVYLAKIAGWVMPLIALAALSRFAMSVSYARDLSKPIYTSLWAVIAVCCAFSLCILAEFDLPRALLNATFASCMLVIIGALCWIAWRSQAWLWLIVASLLPIIASAMARLAYNIGWVSHMEVALFAGVLSAAAGLTSAYTVLIGQQRQRSATAQREDALETIDGATGLYAERIARARLPLMILRSQRFNKACGVIMVRWTGFQSTMSSASAVDRGRIFAHLGNRINRLARDVDTAARFGDDRFILLVEAPITRSQLSDVASRILASCMRPSNAMPDQKGFDLHMALWLSSELPADAAQVLELLKTRMNQMLDGTQRRVQFISVPLSTAPPTDQSDPEHGSKLVEKINALEATQGLPTIKLTPIKKSMDSSATTGSTNPS